MNYYKDEEEQFEKLKLLCRFINPELATRIFDQTVIDSGEADSQEIFDELSKDLGGKYSAEEIAAMTNDPEHYHNLDKIERVE